MRADYVVSADAGASPVPPAVGEALARRPGTATVTSVRQDSASAFGPDHSINGLDPATSPDVLRLAWDAGSAASLTGLGANGAILQRDFAEDHDLHVASRFGIETARGRKLALTVKGMFPARRASRLNVLEALHYE